MTGSQWVSQPVSIDKPWGNERIFGFVEGLYCGKILTIEAGHSLSLQYHKNKHETVSVWSGRLSFSVGDDANSLDLLELGPGDCVELAPGTVHRMEALERTIVLEVSTSQLDDVVRLDDRYGRAN